MKAATISELKQELSAFSAAQLTELCCKLARFKKENKELLSYLIFDAHRQDAYYDEVKSEINDFFFNLPKGSAYIVKKKLRKVLTIIAKYSRFNASRQFEVEMRIHFCTNLQKSPVFNLSPAITNLYIQQLNKIKDIVKLLHEDLHYDYDKQIKKLKG